MKELPISIGIISFVAGLVLLIAAVVGQKIEIAAVKMPELVDPKRRVLTAILGAVLILFGALENRSAVNLPMTPAQAAMPAQPNASITTSVGATLSQPTGGCLTGIQADDLQTIPVERGLRTDRKFNSGQPRDGVITLRFTQSSALVGAVTLRTLGSGLGFRIMGVYDSACAPVTSYTNITNSGSTQGAVGQYETMEYRFPGATVRMDIAYCEDRDCLQLRAQQVAP